MSSHTLLYLVIGVAVLGLIIYRQLVARLVQGNQRLMLILVVIGLVEAVPYMQNLHAGSAAVIALMGSLILAWTRQRTGGPDRAPPESRA
jgi:hypothetical protein